MFYFLFDRGGLLAVAFFGFFWAVFDLDPGGFVFFEALLEEDLFDVFFSCSWFLDSVSFDFSRIFCFSPCCLILKKCVSFSSWFGIITCRAQSLIYAAWFQLHLRHSQSLRLRRYRLLMTRPTASSFVNAHNEMISASRRTLNFKISEICRDFWDKTFIWT